MYTMLYIIYVADSRVLVKEVHDRSLFSGCVAVELQFLLSMYGSDSVESFFDRVFGVMYLKEEVDHLLSLFFEVCVV